MKKILEICALIVLMACLISGCTKKSNEEIEKRVYYEETEIPLPEETSILYDIESADQQLVVLAGGETISGRKYSYEENENSWKEGGAVWKDIEDSVVFEAKFLNKKQNYVSVLYQALLAQSEEEGKMLEPKYFVLEEDGSTEELSLNLSEGDAYTEDNLFHCMVSDKNKLVGVDNGGVISCFSMDGILLYTDEEPHKAESGVVGMVLDKEILYVVMDNGKVLCLDAETGEHKEGSESLVEFLKFTEGSYLAECDGTNVYKIQKNKLYQYDLKKKAAKELMDFSGYDLEDGYDYLLSPSGEGEFYISCISRTGQNILRKYTYIKEGIQVQKDALTIYSLEENSNIQMLADAFEAKNPDISIKVEYGYTEEDGKTREDAMELLNTEMMAGKGPDILVLDGLSTDAYIQKGMLKDLEEILDLEVMERELFSNLLTPYKMEGGQFAIPCGFSLYGITGEKEAVRAFHDTEQLLAYAKEKKLPFAVHDYNLAEAANIVYLQNISSCFQKDGTVNVQNLERLFDDLATIFSLSGNSFGEDNRQNVFGDDWEINSMDHEVEWIYYENLPFVLAPYQTTNSIKASNYLEEEKDLSYGFLEKDGSLVYQDKMVLGVSSHSNQTEAAGELIQYVLSEGVKEREQDLTLLPANRQVLETLLTGDQKIHTISSFGYGDDPEMIDVKGKDLTKEQWEDLADQISRAVKVEYADPQIREVIFEEAGRYCLGEKDKDQSLEETKRQIELYRKE